MDMDTNDLLNFIRKHGVTQNSKPYLKQMMLQGPSPDQRKYIWLKVTGAEKLIINNHGYYDKLLEKISGLESTFMKQIKRDLHRTFPTESVFKSVTMQNALQRVLNAYSFRNPNVGYWQGMNWLAGRILTVGFSEEETFWMLSCILECLLPIDYFNIMDGVMIDQKVFQHFARANCKKVIKHLKKLDMDISFFSIQWFICLFSYNLSMEVCLRIWDVYFIEGNAWLFKVGLALLCLNQKRICKIKELGPFIAFLEAELKAVDDPLIILAEIEKKKYQNIDDETIQQLRNQYRGPVVHDITRLIQFSLSEEQFIESLPYVWQNEDECRFRCRKLCDYFTFMSTDRIELIEDYMHPDYPIQELPDTEALTTNLLVGARNHRCRKEQSDWLHQIESSFIEDEQERLFRASTQATIVAESPGVYERLIQRDHRSDTLDFFATQMRRLY